MHDQTPHDDVISRARKRIVRMALAALACGGTFCIMLGFGICQGWSAFAVFRGNPRHGGGGSSPLVFVLIATALATPLLVHPAEASFGPNRDREVPHGT